MIVHVYYNILHERPFMIFHLIFRAFCFGIVARTWRLCGELVLVFDAATATAAEEHRASLCWALRAPESRAAGAVDAGPSWTILWQRDQQNQQNQHSTQHTVTKLTKASVRIRSFDVHNLWQSMTIYIYDNLWHQDFLWWQCFWICCGGAVQRFEFYGLRREP